jgi:diacylglycerol kinase (ATP)
MTRHRSFFVLFNPAAGYGRARKLIPTYERLLQRYVGDFDHGVSSHAGGEIELADKALSDGYESIVVVGGDGTWGIVADRIVRSRRKDVTLGLLPAGTGNDFGKSLGVRADVIENVIRGMADGRRRTIDVGRVGERYFLNVVGFGFDIAVIDDSADMPLLHGDLRYQFCALRQLFKFPGLPISISAGPTTSPPRHHLMLTISNGNYFGGSFHIAPNASLSDGKLDAVSIYDGGPLMRMAVFVRVAKGKHEAHDKVSVRQARAFELVFDAPVRYEVDGEVYTLDGSSINVEAVPDALSVYLPTP